MSSELTLLESRSSLKDKLRDAGIVWPKDDSRHTYFVPADELKSLITTDSVSTELRLHVNADLIYRDISALSERIVLKAPKIFSILICQDLGHCILDLLEAGLHDEDLPLTKLSSPDKASSRENSVSSAGSKFKVSSKSSPGQPLQCMHSWNGRQIAAFILGQWSFVSPVFYKKEHWRLDSDCILPFIEEQKINDDGSSISIRSVRIHPAHQLLNRRITDPNPFVLIKRAATATEFENEVSMLSTLSQPYPSLHFQELLGTYSYRKELFLIFRMGDRNLRDYLESNPYPEFCFERLHWALYQCKEIVCALQAIRRLSKNDDSRHWAIKPENILWIPATNTEGKPGRFIDNHLGRLIIACSGLPHAKTRAVLNPPLKLLKHQKAIHQLPQTEDRSLNMVYHDIWNLGFIYLELLTWLVGGSKLLSNSHSALSENKANTYLSNDSIYSILEVEVIASPRLHTRRTLATQWISALIDKPPCSKFIRDFLALIDENMLVVDPKDQISSADLLARLENMLRKANEDSQYLAEPKTGTTIGLVLASEAVSVTQRKLDLKAKEQMSALLYFPDPALTGSEIDQPSKPMKQISHQDSAAGLPETYGAGAEDVIGQKNPALKLWPHPLESALAAPLLEQIQYLLREDFDMMAQGDFMWLSELRDHGYSTDEIAQVLVDERNDSPWIIFEQRVLPNQSIILDHHQPSCVHTNGQSTNLVLGLLENASSKSSEPLLVSKEEGMLYLEELFGLAGIAPRHNHETSWFGSVKFDDENGTMTASVSFEQSIPNRLASEQLPPVSQADKIRNITKSIRNLSFGVGFAQSQGICCKTFTCLFLPLEQVGHPVIKLCCIQFSAIVGLRWALNRLLGGISDKIIDIDADMDFVRWSIAKVFQDLTVSLFPAKTLDEILDLSSLTIQFLSLAFCSYLRAHIGPLKPFFLDSPLHRIHLYGLNNLAGRPSMTASLYKFTCFHEMLMDPVLVFSEGGAMKHMQERYDLLASPQDLMDTWGPGQFITSSGDAHTSEGHLTAIMIGGGTIKPTGATTDGQKVFHWSRDIDPHHDSSVRFSAVEKITISAVEVNETCRSDQIQRWSSFSSSFENIGTSPSYWQLTEFQAGISVMASQFAGGQLQFNKTWTWHPGNSWKHQYLALIADDLPLTELDRPWGVLVSACTGVSRRVPLRVLLADTLPAFASNLTSTPKGWLVLQPGIVRALQQSSRHLKQWYDDLSTQTDSRELQNFCRRLIRHILLVLRDTGIDRDHKTFRIACPQGHNDGAPITMCLPVPCERACLWAQILTDTENCATFACMTTQCLESQEHKCQTTSPWHCPSLDTAVQQLRSREDPIIMQTQAWSLVTDALYWIGSLESGLQAKVVKSANSPIARLHISKSRIPQKTRARLGAMLSKRDRLRERQIDTWPAEDVLVLS